MIEWIPAGTAERLAGIRPGEYQADVPAGILRGTQQCRPESNQSYVYGAVVPGRILEYQAAVPAGCPSIRPAQLLDIPESGRALLELVCDILLQLPLSRSLIG